VGQRRSDLERAFGLQGANLMGTNSSPKYDEMAHLRAKTSKQLTEEVAKYEAQLASNPHERIVPLLKELIATRRLVIAERIGK
jgi:hypothetical protein